MKRTSCLRALTAVVLLYGQTFAIIVRHDTGSGDYLASERDYPAVFYLQHRQDRKVCVATLVHPRWAITAAHCLKETGLESTIAENKSYPVSIAGRSHHIEALEVHPEFGLAVDREVDLALLRLSAPVTTVQVIPLYQSADELGQVVTLLGWGYFGIGTTGRQFDDGEFRRATNRVTVADRRLSFTFDDPRIFGTEVLELEGFPGLGDSGGPAFIETAAGVELAGVAVGELEGVDFSEETQGSYGAVSIYERISLHIGWIHGVVDDVHQRAEDFRQEAP